MGTVTKLGEAGIKLDCWFHNLNKKFNPKYSNWAYGRGLEQASGLGFLLIAPTMLFGYGFGLDAYSLDINNYLWAWMAFILGFCQLYYNGLIQRKVYNLMATSAWITIAIGAMITLEGWNIVSAIALPYCLCSFYVYGFLLGEHEAQPQGEPTAQLQGEPDKQEGETVW